jgi:hypothetical protein
MAGLRDSTWASYRMNVEKQLVPGLGAIELQRLSPAQLNAFYRELLTQGRRKRAGGAGAEDGALHPFDPASGAAGCGALGLCRAERGRCC